MRPDLDGGRRRMIGVVDAAKDGEVAEDAASQLLGMSTRGHQETCAEGK